MLTERLLVLAGAIQDGFAVAGCTATGSSDDKKK